MKEHSGNGNRKFPIIGLFLKNFKIGLGIYWNMVWFKYTVQWIGVSYE